MDRAQVGLGFFRFMFLVGGMVLCTIPFVFLFDGVLTERPALKVMISFVGGVGLYTAIMYTLHRIFH